MFQETSLMKKNNNKSIIDKKLGIKMKNISRRFILLLSKTNIKYKIIKENKLIKIDNHPTIYAVNHYSAQDTPIACNSINEHAYILAGKQRLGFLDNAFFKLYGSIFVDRKNKNDMSLAKEAMIQYLQQNESIIMFPEGTWNLSDNLLVLNMKWGIIDIASQTNSQIIPINLDYDRQNMKCYVRYGEPILVKKNCDKLEEIKKLRDVMATLRYNSLMKYDIIKRNMIDLETIKSENRSSIDEFPKIDIDYEESIIYKPNSSNEDVFEPIKKLKLTKNNAFLFYKGNKGIL